MKILLSCAGGMSSSIVADGIIEAANKVGNTDISIDATGTESVEEDLKNQKYDLILLAPQVAYRRKYIEKLAATQQIPVVPIKGTEYNPIAAPKLYQEIKDTLG